MWLTGKAIHLSHIQQHLLVRVIVADLDQRARTRDLDTQFLAQLTGQRRFDALPRFHLAAGELPQAALMLSIRTTGDQDATIGTTDDRCHYMNPLHPSRSARPACCQAWKAGHW